MIKIIKIRDSVCAGDDVNAPHESEQTLDFIKNVDDLLKILTIGYLPTVSGHNHKWICLFNGEQVGEIIGNREKFSQFLKRPLLKSENIAYFKYFSALK